MFGVDNSSSSHSNNRKKNVLLLGKGPTFGINGIFGVAEKKFDINFSKVNTKFCLSLHYNDNNSYLYVDGREIFKSLNLNLTMKMLTFQLSFVLEVFLMDLVLLRSIFK